MTGNLCSGHHLSMTKVPPRQLINAHPSLLILCVQGSATLSMAYAAALFGDACLRGLNGSVATECTYVESDVVPDIPFFATKVKLGTEGK